MSIEITLHFPIAVIAVINMLFQDMPE